MCFCSPVPHSKTSVRSCLTSSINLTSFLSAQYLNVLVERYGIVLFLVSLDPYGLAMPTCFDCPYNIRFHVIPPSAKLNLIQENPFSSFCTKDCTCTKYLLFTSHVISFLVIGLNSHPHVRSGLVRVLS